MALTINNRLKIGALDGLTDEFNIGASVAQFIVLAGAVELAALLLANPAFAAAAMVLTNAQAVSGVITKDTSVSPGTIDTFALTDRDLTTLLGGSVGLAASGADFIVDDNIIPAGATEVSSTGITLALAIS